MLSSLKKAGIAKLVATIMVALMVVVGFAACGDSTTSTGATLTGISVSTQPTTTQFEVGSTFDYSGAKVTLTFDDNTTQVVSLTAGMIGYYDFSTIGQKDVTVTYTVNGVSKSATIAVTVVDTLGDMRVAKVKQITDYVPAAVKNDTVVLALTEAYVSSVNLATKESDATALVNEFKAAIDAYVAGTGDGGDYDALIEELQKQAAELAAAVKKAEEEAQKAQQANLLAALKITKKAELDAAKKVYSDKHQMYYAPALKDGADKVIREAIDNYSSIETIYNDAYYAVTVGDSEVTINAVVSNAISSMAAVKTVAQSVYDAVSESVTKTIVIGIVFRSNPWENGQGWDTVVTYHGDDSKAMIVDLENMLVQALSANVRATTDYITVEKTINDKTIQEIVQSLRAEYTNLELALASAEATDFYAAVNAVVANDKLVPAVINAQTSTDTVTNYVTVGSKASIDAVNATFEAFVDKFFADDEDNVNIDRILNTNLANNTSGYIAKMDSQNAAWDNLVAAANSATVRDLILSIYNLGSGTLSVNNNHATEATAVDTTKADGVVLYTDLVAIKAYETARAAWKASFGLTDAQVNTIIDNTIVPITATYSYKLNDTAKTAKTTTITTWVKIDSGVLSLGEFTGATVTAKLANVKDRAQALTNAFNLLSTRTFDGMFILDAISAFNAKYPVITYAAAPDALYILEAMAEGSDADGNDWLRAAIDAYAKLGGQLGTAGAPNYSDPNYQLFFTSSFMTSQSLVKLIIGDAKAMADSLVANIEAIGTVTTASKTDIETARAAYKAFVKYLSDNKLDASNINLVSTFTKFVQLNATTGKYETVVALDETVATKPAKNNVFYLNILVAAEKEYVIELIKAIGEIRADATDFTAGEITLAKGTAPDGSIVVARKAYDAWAKGVSDTSLKVKVGTVTYDYVLLLAKAEAQYIVLNLEDKVNAATDVITADLAGAASSVTRMNALKAYKAWVASGAEVLDADGKTYLGAKIKAIVENEAKYIRNLIDAIDAFVVYSNTDDSSAGITTARNAYNAYTALGLSTFTFIDVTSGTDTTLKSYTADGTVNTTVLTAAENKYANEKAYAISANALLNLLPSSLAACTSADLANMRNILTVYKYFSELNVKVNSTSEVLEDRALTLADCLFFDYEADGVTVAKDSADNDIVYCLTSSGDKYYYNYASATQVTLPAGTLVVTSLEVDNTMLNSAKYAIYANDVLLKNQIAKVEFSIAVDQALASVQALGKKYQDEALTSAQITAVTNIRINYVSSIEALVCAGESTLAADLAKLAKLVSDCEIAMQAALN